MGVKITPEYAYLALELIKGARMAMDVIQTGNLDELPEGLRMKLESEHDRVNDAWKKLLPAGNQPG